MGRTSKVLKVLKNKWVLHKQSIMIGCLCRLTNTMEDNEMFKGIRKYREMLYTTALKAGYKRYKDRYRVYGGIYNDWIDWDWNKKDFGYVHVEISTKAFHEDKVTALIALMMQENMYKYRIVEVAKSKYITQDLHILLVKDVHNLEGVLRYLNSNGSDYNAYELDRDITDVSCLF